MEQLFLFPVLGAQPHLLLFKGPVQISWASAVSKGTLDAHFMFVFIDPSH